MIYSKHHLKCSLALLWQYRYVMSCHTACNVIPLVEQAGGDVITEMLGMMRNSPIQTVQAKSIHHMISQLVHREPSEMLRRPSMLVHPVTSEVTARRASQFMDSIPHDPSTTIHRPPTAPQQALFERATTTANLRHPFSTTPDPHFNRYHYTRRHTLSSVPESIHLPSSSSKEL